MYLFSLWPTMLHFISWCLDDVGLFYPFLVRHVLIKKKKIIYCGSDVRHQIETKLEVLESLFRGLQLFRGNFLIQTFSMWKLSFVFCLPQVLLLLLLLFSKVLNLGSMAIAIKLSIFYYFTNNKYSEVEFSSILLRILNWLLVLGRVINLVFVIIMKHYATLHQLISDILVVGDNLDEKDQIS